MGSFVPTVKVSSNTALAAKKRNWIDFDAGALLSADSPDELDDAFWKYVLSVAEGKETRNEVNGCREIAIFKDGVIL